MNTPTPPLADLIDRVIIPALLARLVREQPAPKPQAA